ncbi:MAG: 50S ribosomal protein L3 [Candidatus Sungbacteria bacterium]|nr:50S ribosomal protein L3 [Candidatus Sungbacteria bacterium]
MKCLLGEKVNMSQIFDAAGNVIPVTFISVLPNTVIHVRTKEKDGYSAVQLGAGEKNAKNITKPQIGHFKGLGNFRYVKEFRVKTQTRKKGTDAPADVLPQDMKVGTIIDASVFQEGDRVRVSGISKAKGFQGVVKRHGFHGAPASHGTKHAHRQPGSIGATWPQRVIKGMRMAGRMGADRVTVRKVKVERVDAENKILALRGAIPGRRGTLVEIRG